MSLLSAISSTTTVLFGEDGKQQDTESHTLNRLEVEYWSKQGDMEDNCGVLTVAWMQDILSSEQHCSGVGQPVCQGWLKDISYTRVAFTFDRKQFSCLWHYCCILFEPNLKNSHSGSQCASCWSSTSVSYDIRHICSVTPQSYTFINKVWGGVRVAVIAIEIIWH